MLKQIFNIDYFRNNPNEEDDENNLEQYPYQLTLPRSMTGQEGNGEPPMMQRVQRSKANMWDMGSDGYLYDFVK